MKQSEQYTDDMQPDGGRKPTYIKEQHNYNCQQFFREHHKLHFHNACRNTRKQQLARNLKHHQ